MDKLMQTKNIIKRQLFLVVIITTSLFACNRSDEYLPLNNPCNNSHPIVMTANNWIGRMSYNNSVEKWAVNVPILNTIDGLRTCIICGNLPDSFKVNGKQVTISGQLKDGNNNPKPEIGGQVIYYITEWTIK
jgi:cytochrome c-type biogenesis protein CcmE